MKAVGDKISVKSISEIRNEGFIDHEERDIIFIKEPCKWMLNGCEPYLGKEAVKIEEVDRDDAKIPYRITGGFWIPEFMVKDYVEPERTETVVPTVTTAEGDQVKYGKIFKFMIKLEKKVKNTTVIKQTNINRISCLPEDVLGYIQAILQIEYPEYEIVTTNIAEHVFNFVSSKID